MEMISRSVEETFNLGKCLGKVASDGDIFCLSGDLGVGKTHFAKGLAAGLGITEHITSPTYNIVNEYSGTLRFIHFDVYRIGEPEEMFDIGFDEYLNGSGVILIEWSNLIEILLPQDRLDIKIEKFLTDSNIDSNQHTDMDNYRKISFEPNSEHFIKLVEEMKSLCTF